MGRSAGEGRKWSTQDILLQVLGYEETGIQISQATNDCVQIEFNSYTLRLYLTMLDSHTKDWL